ncbi:Pyruvate carboxylase [Zancudomyces culisetae]|uniref:pyruvate carboxylase n=1 Tax=Zancudomyces culisetae TaxID=1213189 RepID=A0A1R1PP30_ZANCU|nr:Pyruvate carboxylase [Zancudomyces culisetae]|eukprot:OMH82710.1 Pyruvate carboxylase [Zancudomyces culisetae]
MSRVNSTTSLQALAQNADSSKENEQVRLDFGNFSYADTPKVSRDSSPAVERASRFNNNEVEQRYHIPNEAGLEHLSETSDLITKGFNKVLIANRGEISMRIIRSAHELGMSTVAVHSYDDRLSMHKYKADESYQIGVKGQFSPVGAYLAQDEILAIALKSGCHAIHPGYGFLAENSEFAKKVEDAGIRWVGPRPETIERVGDKIKAREVAIDCGIPVVPGTDGPISTHEQAVEFVEEHGFPVIIKAAMGGGGRGMRVVHKMSELQESFERATSEALASFGDGTVFIERYVERPKHIEVQLLGDGTGDVVHLFERDCSVQRRYQKVVEFGPAVSIDDELRQKILNDAVKLAKFVKYRNAGTAEFLVDKQGRHYFIEINPRIQVEHTVTEEITHIDLVAMQLYVASGRTLKSLNLSQENIKLYGYAIQCRVTTEDPLHGFQPDVGRIEVYRSPGGPGVRLDGGSGFVGSVITPHYDSLLVKLTCSGSTFEKARRRTLASLVEFRIRGVKTNMSFVQRLLSHKVFISGDCWTTFIDDTPELLDTHVFRNRSTKLLAFLGDMVVNGSNVQGQVRPALPGLEVPIVPQVIGNDGKVIDVTTKPPPGWRQVLLEKGPKAFAAAIRAHKGVLITDTTWRDAHQSLMATRLRTAEMKRIAATTSHAFSNAFSLEMWGGATFDVCMRFLHEDPWDRLDQLRKLVPNVPFQMLLRGANAVGYTSYPDNVVYKFCKEARDHGVDVFRIFDSLNYIENMRLGIDAVRKANGVVEAAICYTGDVSNPRPDSIYTLEYYMNLVDELVALDIDILGIKDMAGLLKPQAAKLLISEIRKKHPDLPIHVHTHDTAGTGVTSMLEAARAGADIVDLALDSMSGVTSQPCMGAFVASVQGTELDTGISLDTIRSLNSYWEQVRILYASFDPGVKASDTSVYYHEMPGGQYTNLMFQAQSLGLGMRWNEVKTAYAQANMLCGDIVKVTPSSKVVGDFAQFIVSNSLKPEEVLEKASTLSFPSSVVEFFQGYLGQPSAGFPEPLRSKIIKNLARIDKRPGIDMLPFDFDKLRKELEEKWQSSSIREVDLLSAALYPTVFDDFMAFKEKFGDISYLETPHFLNPLEIDQELEVEIEKGKKLVIKLVTVSQLNEALGRRDVYFEVNGELRLTYVLDNTVKATMKTRTKANSKNAEDLGSPMTGEIVDLRVEDGDVVEVGQTICILSAMKMETVVSAHKAGKISDLSIAIGDRVEQGDLLIKITPVEEKKE